MSEPLRVPVPAHLFTRLPAYPLTRLPAYPLTRSPAYPLTRLPVQCPRACRYALPREDTRAVREPELSGLGGLPRGQLVRIASRARVQRDSQRHGARGYLAALQV